MNGVSDEITELIRRIVARHRARLRSCFCCRSSRLRTSRVQIGTAGLMAAVARMMPVGGDDTAGYPPTREASALEAAQDNGSLNR